MKNIKVFFIVTIGLFLLGCSPPTKQSQLLDERKAYYTGWHQHCFAIVASLATTPMTKATITEFCAKDLQEAVNGHFYENKDANGNPIFTIPLPTIIEMPQPGNQG